MANQDNSEKGKKDKLSEEDQALFRDAVKGSRPIKRDRVIHRQGYKQNYKQSSQQPSQFYPASYDHNNQSDDDYLDNIDYRHPEQTLTAQDSLFYTQSGLQHRTIKQLKRGQFAIEATLDLHGCHRDQANLMLHKFIDHAQQQHKRHIIIIHGKGLSSPQGTAVLKNHVNYWLRNHSSVLAFCSALARDGGSGAIYVLLKKKA